MAKSQGKQCAAGDCFSREYKIIDGTRTPSGIKFFSFPLKEKSRVNQWCNLIRRRNNSDGFVVNKHTRLCEKHFEKKHIYRPPGGTKSRLLEGAKPVLHSWNNFSINFAERDPPKVRKSPRKRVLSGEDEETDNRNIDDMLDVTASENNNTSYTESIDLQINCESLEDENKMLKLEIEKLKAKLKASEEAYQNLLLKVNKAELEIMTHVKNNDNNCKHYTAFPSWSRLFNVFEFLDAGNNGENVTLYHNQDKKEKGLSSGRGRPRSLSPLESFILTLMRLRRNFSVTHLSYLFRISESTISSTIITWINYMYFKLGSVSIWPNSNQIYDSMTDSMRAKYPHVKCIIDCVEFKVEVPVSLIMHKLFYSSYKSHTTVKCLVGIAPTGGFNFISSVFPGSISDKEITVRSGVLNPLLWNSGDGLMADRGFTIGDYTKPLGIDLIIPDFLKGRDQLDISEVVNSQQIASERIHVERMIQRLKCYHIFDGVIPLTMIGSLNQMITVCGMLSNFQDPIIKKPDSSVTN